MQASDWITRFLATQRVEAVYEVAGGMIATLIDALYRDGRVRIVSSHHEQAAGFAAEGHARMTGVPGVAMGTSGPGAINLLTAVGSCYFDSTPAVFITGQVNRAERKRGRPIRQLGFQETDVVAMTTPIAKAAWSVEEAHELPGRLTDAFRLAQAGRPGPVLVDVPMDLQRAELDAPLPTGLLTPAAAAPADAAFPDRVLGALLSAERPLILAGGGLRSARAVAAFRALVADLAVPVVHSLMGVDALPFSHPLRVGLIGTYGNRWANIALSRCDALLVLGSRLDIRQTGADTEAFTTGRSIYHVDCDPGELNNRVSGCDGVVSELGPAIAALSSASAEHAGSTHDAWLAEIDDLRHSWPDTGELSDVAGINPNLLLHQLSDRADVAAYVADVGQHQMWAAQSLELREQQRFLTSGGMGAMGSGLPLAMGAANADRGPVVLIAGDGGFQLNIQELQTVVHHDLAIKSVILNNNCQGMVRQFQDSYFDGRHQSSIWGYSAPSFAAVAAAYGIPAQRIEDPADVPGALNAMWASDGPYLLDVAIDVRANAYPKIAFGHSIDEMEPFVAPNAMEAT
ncbi:MAG TPA: thiamine pyrophosphate-binding protein [Solirubrobacteraceae bacterium]|nr:thiamine pyrophosphate-binding protein [Solirubrobacteraceae bacterium]